MKYGYEVSASDVYYKACQMFRDMCASENRSDDELIALMKQIENFENLCMKLDIQLHE